MITTTTTSSALRANATTGSANARWSSGVIVPFAVASSSAASNTLPRGRNTVGTNANSATNNTRDTRSQPFPGPVSDRPCATIAIKPATNTANDPGITSNLSNRVARPTSTYLTQVIGGTRLREGDVAADEPGDEPERDHHVQDHPPPHHASSG